MYKFAWARKPVRKKPRENKYTHVCGARGPARQGPREINKHTYLCWARWPVRQGPRNTTSFMLGGLYAKDLGRLTNSHIYVKPGGPYPRDPASETNSHIYVGPRGPYARDPGGSTSTHINVETGGPRDPGGVNKYTHLCGDRCPRTPRTPGG